MLRHVQVGQITDTDFETYYAMIAAGLPSPTLAP